MSLDLKFSIIQSADCKSFGFRDDTGDYSATNPGGYGAPNPEMSSMTSAALTIVLSNGTSVVLSDSQGFAPPDFPNTDGTVFAVTSELLGLGADVKIADWISYITYSMVNPGGTYSKSEYKFISCNSRCCLNKLNAASNAAANEGCKPCDNTALLAYLEGEGKFESIGNDLECDPPRPNDANTTLQALIDLCNSNGCGCGC